MERRLPFAAIAIKSPIKVKILINKSRKGFLKIFLQNFLSHALGRFRDSMEPIAIVVAPIKYTNAIIVIVLNSPK